MATEEVVATCISSDDEQCSPICLDIFVPTRRCSCKCKRSIVVQSASPSVVACCPKETVSACCRKRKSRCNTRCENGINRVNAVRSTSTMSDDDYTFPDTNSFSSRIVGTHGASDSRMDSEPDESACYESKSPSTVDRHNCGKHKTSTTPILRCSAAVSHAHHSSPTTIERSASSCSDPSWKCMPKSEAITSCAKCRHCSLIGRAPPVCGKFDATAHTKECKTSVAPSQKCSSGSSQDNRTESLKSQTKSSLTTPSCAHSHAASASKHSRHRQKKSRAYESFMASSYSYSV